MADWDKFWLESSAEASFVGPTGSHPSIVQFWAGVFSEIENDPGGSRCIDIASGNGIVIQCAQRCLANDMPLFAGLDISAAAIKEIARRFPAVDGIVADAASVPFDSYSFDLVTSQFGVEYAGLDAILEAARLVAEGGNLALVLHCRPGAIFEECSASLQAIDRLRQGRLFHRIRATFEAGFAALRNGDRHAYERAMRKLKPAFRLLEQTMRKYGEGVASGFVSRLRVDIEKTSQRLQHHDSRELLVWLEQLDGEALSYRIRMKSMTDAAIPRRQLDQVEQKLTESGFSITEIEPLYGPDENTQLAWSFRARRNSENSKLAKKTGLS